MHEPISNNQMEIMKLIREVQSFCVSKFTQCDTMETNQFVSHYVYIPSSMTVLWTNFEQIFKSLTNIAHKSKTEKDLCQILRFYVSTLIIINQI